MSGGVRRREVLGLAVGGGLALVGVRADSARADAALDLQILQTASSLEALAVAAYDLVLNHDVPPAVRGFAEATVRRHRAHLEAFQHQTTALAAGAAIQDRPNDKFLPALRSADAGTPERLVELVSTIERIVTDTYLTNLAVVADTGAKALVARVMAVEAQHLAHLRLVGALLDAGAPELAAAPLPLARIRDLPHTIGRLPFPDGLHQIGDPGLLAEPSSGAVP